MTKKVARYEVIGNFSPGQFSERTEHRALEVARRFRKRGFRAMVRKITK